MSGNILNTVAIVVGGLIGMGLKKGIPERINKAVMRVQGLSIGIISLSGIIKATFTVNPDGTLSDSGGLLLLISLVVGCIVGELIGIESAIERAAQKIENGIKSDGFAKGFVASSLVFCVGAMAIVGALNEGLGQGSETLYLKSMLDFTTAIILAASLGAGVIFSAIPVLVLQGSISLLAMVIAPFLVGSVLLTNICLVGYAIVLCIGINFIFDLDIKVANLLPSFFIPVIYNFVF